MDQAAHSGDKGEGSARRRPLLFGEVLFDRFADGLMVLGGAPLNVAMHLNRLGFDPLLISRVGSDENGQRARAELRRRGLDTSAIQVDGEKPTGVVDVAVKGGQPTFAIREGVAYDAIDWPDAAAVDLSVPPSIFYHGTLAARASRSRSALQRMCEELRAPRFVDVNLRPPWTPIDRVYELVRGADWIKVNADGFGALLGCATPTDESAFARDGQRLLERADARYLVITLGARGACLVGLDGQCSTSASCTVSAADFEDAVGAGDALAATVIAGAVSGWAPEAALERGVQLAAAVCCIRGAIPDSDRFYAEFLAKWSK